MNAIVSNSYISIFFTRKYFYQFYRKKQFPYILPIGISPSKLFKVCEIFTNLFENVVSFF